MSPTTLTDQINSVSKQEDTAAHVSLSNELVTLLSEQLYQSPLKAIEELIVNSYDAGALECRLYVPPPSAIGTSTAITSNAIVVWDDGDGMSSDGLVGLWRIGQSQKQTTGDNKNRKQIGKFGIGKLAANAVGHRLTYITCQQGAILSTSVDFRAFKTSADGSSRNVTIPIFRIPSVPELFKIAELNTLMKRIGMTEAVLNQKSHWTAALIEDLKPKATSIRIGNLRWVIATALPLVTDFSVCLNGENVPSSKEHKDVLVRFSSDADLTQTELEGLIKATDKTAWRLDNGKIYCDLFPQGISWKSWVTRYSLYGKKSEDISRSHGFFVRVRGRVVNLSDPEFGLPPRSFDTFNRFAADVHIDDLHEHVSSNREDVRDSPEKKMAQKVLNWILTRARARYQETLTKAENEERNKTETQRNFIGSRLVEVPLADALLSLNASGSDADSDWFYLEVPKATDKSAVISRLISEHQKYKYQYSSLGRVARVANLDLQTMTFAINEDHPFVREHSESGRSQRLLEDFVTAEVLLEVYLQRAGVGEAQIGEVLELRDLLLRSLAHERRYSLKAIAQYLRDSAADEKDLEIAIVSAARALGFVAKQISNSGEPDGLARLTRYPGGDIKITLEAKSTGTTPSLQAIDFAGLQAHVKQHQAIGCLLVCPGYPGASKGDESQASIRAKECKISCWTIEQLAKCVENIEIRHLTAENVIEIVTTQFAPDDVEDAVAKLIDNSSIPQRSLCQKIISLLEARAESAPDSVRSVALVTGWITSEPGFAKVKQSDVQEALQKMSAASQGAMHYSAGAAPNVTMLTSVAEIRRRLESVLGDAGSPRKLSVRRGDSEG